MGPGLRAPSLEGEYRMHGQSYRLLKNAPPPGGELATELLELAQELDVGLTDDSFLRAGVFWSSKPSGTSSFLWVCEVAEDYRSVALVPQALGPSAVEERLDAENTAVALAAAILVGLLRRTTRAHPGTSSSSDRVGSSG